MLKTMNMNQEKYWDKAASKKEFTTPFAMEVFNRHVLKTDRILDVGCGYGRVLDELWQEGFDQSCGVDYSPKMIERGKKLFPYLELSEAAIPFGFESNVFDVVILVAVLTCIVEDEVQELMMQEICRVLKPGGVLYINDFLINTDDRNIRRYKAFEKKYNIYGIFELDEGAVLRHHTKDYLAHLTLPFEKLEFEQLVYTTMNKHRSNGFYYLGRLKK